MQLSRLEWFFKAKNSPRKIFPAENCVICLQNHVITNFYLASNMTKQKKYDNKDFENNKKKFSACSRSCGLARMFAWRGIEEGKGPFTLLQSAFVWFSNLVSANWIWSANINCSFLIVKGRPIKKIEGKYRETREKVNELRKKHDDVKQKTADMHHESREFANYIETRREKRWVSKIIQAPHLW